MIKPRLRVGDDRPPQKPKIPTFTTLESLTFAGIASLVKGAWVASMQLPFEWIKSLLTPFVACMLLGYIVAIYQLSEQNPKPNCCQITGGLIIAFFNNLTIFGAVIAGINP